MKKFSVYAFDFPGFGKSKNLKMDKSDFIEDLRNELKLDKFHLFGNFYGGIVSIKYLYQHPKNVLTLILAGVPYYSGIFNFVKFLKIIPKKRRSNLDYLIRDFASISDETLKAVRHPVLLYYGNKDRNATIKMGKKILNLIPGAKMFIAKDRNHGWLGHRIDETGFLKELEEFLTTHSKATY